jgi:hypothetical protein
MALCGFANAQLTLTDTANVLPPRYSSTKKIIEFGWGMLSPSQVRDNMAILSQRPMDGIVFMPRWPEYSNGFPYAIFYPYTVTESYMEYDTLASISWNTTLTDNFLRFWVTGPSYADWFDDAEWAVVTANAERISKADSIARTKGIFLDTEHYGSDVWTYNSTLYPNQTLSQVQAKVRQRGNEFMQALQSHSPGIKVFCTGAWIFPNWETGGNLNNIQNTPYCLLKSFCDGMLEAATGNAKVIDGNEIGYYWRNTINWHYAPGAYKVISDNAFIAPDLKSKSDTNMQVGHGLYYNPYLPINTLTNKRRLEHHVYEELLCTDEYMWFYSEVGQSFWLNPFPADADTAIRSAKYKIAAGQSPGFTISSDTIVTYSNDLQIISPAQNQVFNIGDTIIFEIQSAGTVSNINYYSSYNKLPNIPSPPATYHALAVNPGTYLLYAYSNGYQKLSNPVTYYVSGTSGIAQITAYENLILYPNPSNSFVTIQLDRAISNTEINIFNLQGQIVKSIKNIAEQKIIVSRNVLSDGMYYVQLTQYDQPVTTKKLIILD